MRVGQSQAQHQEPVREKDAAEKGNHQSDKKCLRRYSQDLLCFSHSKQAVSTAVSTNSVHHQHHENSKRDCQTQTA